MSVKRKVRFAAERPSSSFDARRVEPRAEPLEGGERAFELDRAAVLVAASAVRAMPRSIRARAVSYGAPTACHSSRACSKRGDRSRSSPSPRAGSGRAPTWTVASKRRRARFADLVRVDDALAPRPTAARAVSTSPAASAISTCAGRRRRRKSGSAVSCSVRVIPATAAADLALGEPQEREPRLRVAPELVRRRVRLLGAREVAAPAPDLADLVVAVGGDAAVEVVELLAGGERLRLGRGPVAAQPEHLGPVDPAGAGEAGDVELVAPAVRRLRPLGRPAEVAEVLARADRDAVDEPGRVRRAGRRTSRTPSPRRAARGPSSISPAFTSVRPLPESASICPSRSPTLFATLVGLVEQRLRRVGGRSANIAVERLDAARAGRARAPPAASARSRSAFASQPRTPRTRPRPSCPTERERRFARRRACRPPRL